jgi:regulation of enolase protein 1 (concanavalin A-like superfamily)
MTKTVVALASGLLCIMPIALPASAQTAEGIKVPGIAKPLSWVNAPDKFKVTSTGIDITSGAKTDRYAPADGQSVTDHANRLLFDADRDFIFTAKITHAFTDKWDAGDLVLEADEHNWLKFCFEKDYTGKHRVVSVLTRGFSDDVNSIAIDSNSVYYRLAKTGDAVFLYASTDGKSWLLVRTFNFHSDVPLKVGLMAQSPVGNGAEVQFTEVSYRPVAMKEFWKAE